ncbi:HEPN domain protein [Planctomycetes bacterium Pan216]|uniref:HEPN domain protein n=1 Tax=Kolteria novifilia TaxID=2527975 RepID=A0A518B431_9BACT|nr:HEPN domain protein [Planctomycetes bacterium Pan216]
MATPNSVDARLFYRCAFHRYEDAQILLKAAHTTGAVYLAGYGVECILKSLILKETPRASQKDVFGSFRGGRAHDYDWLRTQYRQNGGAKFPREVTEAFTLINYWSTDLRYVPSNVRDNDADGFLSAAGKIIDWARGRL